MEEMGEAVGMAATAAMVAVVPPIPRRVARPAAWATAHPGSAAPRVVAAAVRRLIHEADPHGTITAAIPATMTRRAAAATAARHQDAHAVVATTSTMAMMAMTVGATIPTSHRRQRAVVRVRMGEMTEVTVTMAGQGALPGGGAGWANWSATCRAS